MCVFSACMSVFHMHALCVLARHGYRIPWNLVVISWHVGTGNWILVFWKYSHVSYISPLPIQHDSYSICECVHLWQVFVFMRTLRHMHVSVYICVGCSYLCNAQVYAHAATDARRQLWDSFLRIHLPFSEIGSLFEVYPWVGLGGCSESPRDLPVSVSVVLGLPAPNRYTQHLLLLLLLVCFGFNKDPRNWTLNLDSNAHKTNILLIEPTPQISNHNVVALIRKQ